MAQLVGQGPIGTPGDTSAVDSTAKLPLGTVAKDKNGNEYIYLLGVANTAAGHAVIYVPTTYQTALLPATGATCVGPVAVAMAATVAATYGWYQIYGMASVKAGTAAGTAIRKQLFSATSASATGWVSDTYQAGNQVHGMVSLSSSTAAPGDSTITVFMNRPWVNALSDT